MFGKPGEGFMRLNIGCPRSVLERALQQLAVAVKEVRSAAKKQSPKLSEEVIVNLYGREETAFGNLPGVLCTDKAVNPVNIRRI